MSAVHMDETTPHMHAFILPVQETEKGLKLNARDVVGRKDLQHFHEDLNKKVDHDLGYHCSVQTGETIENKSLSKFKLDKMREELHQMQEEVSKIEGVKNLNERHQKTLEAYYDLLDKYEALESQISDLGISLTDDYLER
uniref:Plasmid recombination enzyme n=1 Tax=uncultured prokaryote TaxID=198431 RepID=A0A0H5Q8Z5_9ZZZZ|nr:hypothetical protein [uncultured prokaryote]